MKVYFVGIHNKPGMEPLDSRTYTGRVVDEIIAQIGCDGVKTNMCDVEVFPANYQEVIEHAHRWHVRHRVVESDLVVLLGNFVHQQFDKLPHLRYLNLPHPSALNVRRKKMVYVANAVRRIKEKMV